MRKAICAACALLLAISLASCHTSFDGSRTGNDSQLIMTYSIFDTTDTQTLKLEQGDVIDADIVSEAGQVSICLQNDDAIPIYEKEDVPTDTFQIMIPESGTYLLTVFGEKARGSVSFIKNTD